MLLITYSSSYASSACGSEDGFLLKQSVSAKCFPAIWVTLIEISAHRSSHIDGYKSCLIGCVKLLVLMFGGVFLSAYRICKDGSDLLPTRLLAILIHYLRISFPCCKEIDWQIRSVLIYRQVVLAMVFAPRPFVLAFVVITFG